MGSGFKDFGVGDVLAAADVDGYLMRQTVMTFADASARDTALSGVLDEGMHAYLEDTNHLWYYTGSAWQLASPALVGQWQTTQALAASEGPTSLTFDTEALDVFGMGSVGSATITVPSTEGGLYGVALVCRRTSGTGTPKINLDPTTGTTGFGNGVIDTESLDSTSRQTSALFYLAGSDVLTLTGREVGGSASANVTVTVRVYKLA